MRKTSYSSYVLLLLLFVVVLFLPEPAVKGVRGLLISSFTPAMAKMLDVRLLFSEKMQDEDTQKLAIENRILQDQIDSVKEWVLFEDRIEEQLQRFKKIASISEGDLFWRDFFRRRSEEMKYKLELQMQTVPAKVIFRDPATWSSLVWINVGMRDNEMLGKTIIAKNSPVVLKDSIVGIVEEVQYRQSRVRFITDSRLVASVRAVRGEEQNERLLENLETLTRDLELREDLFETREKAALLFQSLAVLKQKLQMQIPDRYLAKGELYGSSQPLWRSRGNHLKGVGFNYDFDDLEGSSRDLRTGEILKDGKYCDPLPILKLGDLLVTSGYDGVFPRGFKIAIVSKIQQLREGATSYEIEALPTAGSLDEIDHVMVLPPIRIEEK